MERINELHYLGNTLTKLDHPNIPKYYNAFGFKDDFFIISEYIKSSSNLRTELKNEILFREDQAQTIIKQLLSVIKYCLKTLTKFQLNIHPECINFYDKEKSKRIFVNYIFLIFRD